MADPRSRREKREGEEVREPGAERAVDEPHVAPTPRGAAGPDVPPGATHTRTPAGEDPASPASTVDAYDRAPTRKGPAKDPAVRTGSATRWLLALTLLLVIAAFIWFFVGGVGTDVPPPQVADPPPPEGTATPGADPGAPPVATPQTLPLTDGVAPPAEEGGPTTVPLPEGQQAPAQQP